jgi:HD-GYP domain-containing protein (c-di-GMP phosphodiesterase class II)
LTTPAEILSWPVALSPAEFALIQAHSERGYKMLKDIDFPWQVAPSAYQHHERFDGSQNSRVLKGDEIALEARILTVAPVVEAMSSHRSYRATLGTGHAPAEVERGRGMSYDPHVAGACLRLFREDDYAIPNRPAR